MKKLALFAIVVGISLTACQKKDMMGKTDDMGFEDPVLVLEKNGYTTNIITPLEKPNGHQFHTKGIIEYSLDGIVVATIDFGSGEVDAKAIKTVNKNKYDIDLKHKGKKSKYDKVIVKPLVKTKDCKYIVEGTIEYWQDGKWVATVDYGEGNCDDQATKKWKDGSKSFSLDWNKKK